MMRPAILVAFLMVLATIASAQEADDWPAQKCAMYRQAWEDSKVWHGTQGLSTRFIDRHDAFIAAGCTERIRVCPRSREELERADLLTTMIMSEGAASSFLPFSCGGSEGTTP